MRTRVMRRCSVSTISTSRPSTSKCSPTAGTRPSRDSRNPPTVSKPWPSTSTFIRLAISSTCTLPLNRNLPWPSSTMRSTSTSYSSRISPTISSSRSSTVTSPAVPPYSSTTIAICSRLRWNSFSRSGTRLVSGTKCAGRMNGAIGPVSAGARPQLLQQVLDEQDADDVVERLVEDRQARVLLLAEQRQQLLDGRGVVDRDDVGPRRHDLAHHRLAEVGEVAQQLARLAFLHRLVLFLLLGGGGRRASEASVSGVGGSRWPLPLARSFDRLVPMRSSVEVSGFIIAAIDIERRQQHVEHALGIAADDQQRDQVLAGDARSPMIDRIRTGKPAELETGDARQQRRGEHRQRAAAACAPA